MQTEHGEPKPVTRPCGCVSLEGPQAFYTPCLACALKNAGLMLVEASKRLAEAAGEAQVEMEASAEAARIAAEDFIGGSD